MNLPSYELTPPLGDGDVLLVVPPFYDVATPSLAVHLLQACARAVGFGVCVLYANLLLAALMGVRDYTRIGFPRHYPPQALLGEWLFGRRTCRERIPGEERSPATGLAAAFGTTWAHWMAISRLGSREPELPALPTLQRMAAQATTWVEGLAATIARRGFRIIGCSTTFAQTNASIALLAAVKARDPGVTTILGGANCEGEMAQGVASLDPDGDAVDYIFSGESEASFVRWLDAYRAARLPGERIIRGTLCADLDALPTPEFAEYYEQLDAALPGFAQGDANLTLPYETSRGCWWGQRHQCTFCGVNGSSLMFRQKSSDRVAHDLVRFAAAYPVQHITMTDSVMPAGYGRTLLPQLGEAGLRLSISYGERADLNLSAVIALKRAGVDTIQPGIEALSSGLLRLMRKGTLASQNIALLRYARVVGMRLLWSLLWGFPGDKQEDYEQTLALLPLLHHLPPPGSFLHLSIDRFSPYFEHPEQYGVRNITPLGSYRAAFPPDADVARLAYHFTADYECDSHLCPELLGNVAAEVRAWQASWRNGTAPAVLHVAPASKGRYVLLDTRDLIGTQPVLVLDEAEARLALVPRPDAEAPDVRWAVDRRIGVVLGGSYVPLATADPEVLGGFEAEARAREAAESLEVLQPSARGVRGERRT